MLLAYHTTPRRSTGETPFSMTYGTETVIPAEIGLCNIRVTDFALEKSDTRLAKDLDLLEE